MVKNEQKQNLNEYAFCNMRYFQFSTDKKLMTATITVLGVKYSEDSYS